MSRRISHKTQLKVKRLKMASPKNKVKRTRKERNRRTSLYLRNRRYLFATGRFPKEQFRWNFIKIEDEWSLDEIQIIWNDVIPEFHDGILPERQPPIRRPG